MYLNHPSSAIELSFAVKYENRLNTLYVSSGNRKCLECGDVGHKRASCPHRTHVEEDEGEEWGEEAVGAGTNPEEAGGAQEQPPGPSDAAGEPGVETPSEPPVKNDAAVGEEPQVTEQTQGDTVNGAPPPELDAERRVESRNEPGCSEGGEGGSGQGDEEETECGADARGGVRGTPVLFIEGH